MQVELAKSQQAEVFRQQQLEQERRDHELAIRLAEDNNAVVEDATTPPMVTK